VDVKLLLESLKSEQTRIGEWVNVIGYITAILLPKTGHNSLGCENARVDVQALLLWSAGPIDTQRYEASVIALSDKQSGPIANHGPSEAAKHG